MFYWPKIVLESRFLQFWLREIPGYATRGYFIFVKNWKRLPWITETTTCPSHTFPTFTTDVIPGN